MPGCPYILLEQTIIPKLKSFGGVFHETVRDGDTGVGMTLESQYGIKENNSVKPDVTPWEFKANLVTGSMKPVTMFTLTPPGSDKRLLEDFAVDGKFYADSPNLPFKIVRTDIAVVMMTETRIYGSWSLDALREKIIEKVSFLAVVQAEKKKIDGRDYFRYIGAKFYSDLDVERFIDEIDRSVKLSIRTRIGKNHGTAFRVNPTELAKFYGKCREITFDLSDRVVGYEPVQDYLDKFLVWSDRATV